MDVQHFDLDRFSERFLVDFPYPVWGARSSATRGSARPLFSNSLPALVPASSLRKLAAPPQAGSFFFPRLSSRRTYSYLSAASSSEPPISRHLSVITPRLPVSHALKSDSAHIKTAIPTCLANSFSCGRRPHSPALRHIARRRARLPTHVRVRHTHLRIH